MSTVATDALLEEIQDPIHEREEDGVAGLAVPRRWPPDAEIPQLLEELDPYEAAAIPRTISGQESAAPLAAGDSEAPADVVGSPSEPDIRQILHL